jgi:hypothetical protein
MVKVVTAVAELLIVLQKVYKVAVARVEEAVYLINLHLQLME